MATVVPGKRRRGLRAAQLAACAVLALTAVFILMTARLRTYSYDRCVCLHCGAERTTERRTFAGMTYSRLGTTTDTEISRVLNPGHRRACQHGWYLLFDAGGTGSLWQWLERGDGQRRLFCVQLMLVDEQFAEELAKMPRPQEVWETICRAERASPRAADDLLITGLQFGGEYPSLSAWWTRNGARLKRLAAPPPATPQRHAPTPAD